MRGIASINFCRRRDSATQVRCINKQSAITKRYYSTVNRKEISSENFKTTNSFRNFYPGVVRQERQIYCTVKFGNNCPVSFQERYLRYDLTHTCTARHYDSATIMPRKWSHALTPVSHQGWEHKHTYFRLSHYHRERHRETSETSNTFPSRKSKVSTNLSKTLTFKEEVCSANHSRLFLIALVY